MSRLVIQTCIELLKIMDSNVVTDKLKVYHILMSNGTFVIYIVNVDCTSDVFRWTLKNSNFVL